MDYTSASGYVTDAQGRRQYQDRDLLNGVKGTSLVAKDRNAVLNALMYLIQAVQIVPNPDDDSQVWAAVEAMIKAALVGSGGSLNFMPAQQGGGHDQINTKVMLGQDTTFPGLRYSYIKGGTVTDGGYLISSYGNVYVTAGTQVGDLTMDGNNRLTYQAVNLNGLYFTTALYSDFTLVQTNLTSEAATRANADAALQSSKVNRSGDTINGNFTVTGSFSAQGTLYTNNVTGIVVTNSSGATGRATSTIFGPTTAPCRFAYQNDGNVVLYNGSGSPILSFNAVTGLYSFESGSVEVGTATVSYNPVPLSQLQGYQYVPSVPPDPTTQNRITNSFLNEDGSLTVVMTSVTGGINAAIPYSYEPSSVTVTTDSNGYPVYQWRVGPLLYQSFTAYASDTSVIVYPTAFSSVPNVFFAPPHIPSSGGNADASLIANETRGTKTATQVEIDVRYVSSGANGAYNTNQYINVLAVGLA